LAVKGNDAKKLLIERMIQGMKSAVGDEYLPSVSKLARIRRDPFRVLISTILSLRTKDSVTSEASRRLFDLAASPSEIAALRIGTIEKAIYPVGFYKTKAGTVKNISRRITEEYGGIVPDSIDELLKFKGVGRKTANLVVTLGYGKYGICVDTHVHRVSNRLGIVDTKTPERTEFALRQILPKKHWIRYNELLVSFGQRVCKPVSPLCSQCPLEKICPQTGVKRHR
jgi:endonuclease-3